MPEFSENIGERTFKFIDDDSAKCIATPGMINRFNRDGFIIVRSLFNKAEMAKVNEAVQNAPDYWNAAFTASDDDGKRYCVSSWSTPGEDILGACCRTKKVLSVCEQLLDRGELYMYSGKVIMKPPSDGGRLEWHQDYGYWYNNENIRPDMLSCFVALTKNDRENGGLEVIRGSHHCGRINHGFVGSQQGADPERVKLVLQDKRFEHVQCNLAAGDAIFFHCNLLHTSQANTSEFKRWNIIYSYNTVANSPKKEHYNAIYKEPLTPLPCDAVKRCQDLTLDGKRRYIRAEDNPNLRDIGKYTNGVMH